MFWEVADHVQGVEASIQGDAGAQAVVYARGEDEAVGIFDGLAESGGRVHPFGIPVGGVCVGSHGEKMEGGLLLVLWVDDWGFGYWYEVGK